MIYFLQPIEGGPIKIGFSSRVENRRVQLEARYGRKLVVLAVIPGDRRKEWEIHKRFSHLRFPGEEQFRPAPELLEFIGRPLLIRDNPEAVERMPPGTKTVRLELSPETHRKLRIIAAEENVSMATLVRRLVVAHLEQTISPFE